MDFKFLESGSPTSKKEIALPAGRYLGLFVRIYGTTGTGVTFAESNLPYTRVLYDGEQYHGREGSFYHKWNNLYGGNVDTFSGGANAPEDVIYMVPFAFPGQQNILLVPGGDIAHASFDFDLDNANWDTNPVYEIYGMMAPGVKQSYDLFVRQADRTVTGAERDNFDLKGRNLAAVYLEDTSDVVDNVTLEVDGVTVWDNIDQDVITQWTSYVRRMEAEQNLAEWNAFERAGGRFRGTINTQASLDLSFNGAGTCEVTKFQIRPNPEN